MPIRLDRFDDGDSSVPARPGTNAHRLLSVLADHPDVAFTPAELAELTDVPKGSIPKTLSRLADDGLVRRVEDGYWAIADDAAATRVAGVLSLSAIEERYGDDYYGRTDDWAADLPDLGENA